MSRHLSISVGYIQSLLLKLEGESTIEYRFELYSDGSGAIVNVDDDRVIYTFKDIEYLIVAVGEGNIKDIYNV